jgi:uncharacterized protein involved in exopolysaccharide biosynthesis
VSLGARYSADHPDVVRVRKEIAALAQEVDASAGADELNALYESARAELAAAREKYSDEHPDVQRLRRIVAELEAQLESASSSPVPAAESASPNPAYVELNARAAVADAELATLRVRHAELRAKVAEYEGRLTQTPQVEREYRNLSRDYENAVAKYQEIRAKQMEAQLAEKLESEQKGERFTLIEPPLLPETPARPNRLAIGFLGMLLSVFGGVGAAAAAEAGDSTIRGMREVARLVGEPPLCAIPLIESRRDRLRKVVRRLLALAAVLAAAAAVASWVHVRVAPLDVAWFVLLNRLGF